MANNSNNKQSIIKKAIAYADKYKVPRNIVLAIIEKESGFNPKAKGDNGKSFGLMQIYTKAHPDYKGGFDIDKNLDYGVKLLSNLIKKHGLTKGVERYNGSGSQARAYARDVLNNRAPRLKSVAAQVMSSSDNLTDQTIGGTDTDTMASNVNNMTGAAAPVQQIPQVEQPTIQVVDPQTGKLINVSTGDLLTEATSPANTPADYLSNVQEQNIQAMLDPRVQQLLQSNAALTPEQINQIQNPQLQALQAMQQAQAQGTQGMYDRLNNLYQQGNDIIMSDPRLQNTGYYVDPAQAERDALAGYSQAIRTGNMGLAPSAADVAAQVSRYKLANMYGMDYDTLVAANTARINNQLNNLNQLYAQIPNLITLAQNGDKNAMAALQEISKQTSALAQEGIKAQGDIDKERVGQVLQTLRTGTPEAITASSAEKRQVQDVYKDALLTDLAGRYGLSKEQLGGIYDIITTGMSGQTQRDVANTQAAVQQRGQDVNLQINRENIPYKTLGAAGQYLGGSAYSTPQQQANFFNMLDPNVRNAVVNPTLTPEGLNTMITNVNNPNSPTLNPTSQGGLQGLWNRYIMGEQ